MAWMGLHEQEQGTVKTEHDVQIGALSECVRVSWACWVGFVRKLECEPKERPWDRELLERVPGSWAVGWSPLPDPQ